MTTIVAVLGGLLLVSFLSGSVLPMASEAALVLALLQFPEYAILLWLVAFVGNFGGGILTYYMGQLMRVEKLQIWLSRKRNGAWVSRIQQWGAPALAASWVPVVGDVFVLAAGILKLKKGPSFFWMALGKGLRYAFVVYFFIE